MIPTPTDTTEVRFGSSVSIRRSDGREQTFRIVGEDEANPSQGTISHASPLARALMGKPSSVRCAPFFRTDRSRNSCHPIGRGGGVTPPDAPAEAIVLSNLASV